MNTKQMLKLFLTNMLLFLDNDMSAFPEDLILGNELHVTSKVSKFLLYYPFKRTEASKIES